MTDYYVFSSPIAGERPDVFTKPEFIKSLSNYRQRQYLAHLPSCFPHAFAVYYNAKNPQLIRSAYGIWRFYCDCTSSRYLNAKELADYQAQSASWLTSQQTREKYDGYLNAMIQGNCLGQLVNVPMYQAVVKPTKHPAPVVSHTNRGNFGCGRVGRPQHAFAVDSQQAKLSRVKLHREYPNAKIGHLNRRYQKRHPISFPVFDDAEYVTSRHSTGRKYSTKQRKSWGSPDRELNKRAMSHRYNDYHDQKPATDQ